MEYVVSYLLLGLLFSLIVDVLNETLLPQEEKETLTWGIRVTSMVIWPYILGVFIKGTFGYYDYVDGVPPGYEVVDELPDEEEE